MKAREEMPLLRCALGPTGRPFGDGLHSVTASGTDGRKAVITRNWDMAGSTLKKPIRGRKMGVGAKLQGVFVIQGKVGGKYEVQYHTGDNNWQVREEITLTANRQLYIDSSSFDEKRFYRVKLVE
jgi:hypothetical protein